MKEIFVDYMKKKLGIPGRDLYEIPTSKKKFPDGANYRLEVAPVQTPEGAKAIIDAAEEYGCPIHRITETRGIMRLTDSQIKDMVEVAKGAGAELALSIGPRAWYDTSAQRATGTPEGGRVGYRLRGSDQLLYAIRDAKRVVDLGCRSLLIYDEGLLWILDNMRKDGIFPGDVKLKVSLHCGHGNPASIKVLANMGADTINPISDLQLPMIASLRASVDIPLDLFISMPKSSGGFVRICEAAEMVRIGSPVYLKCGPSEITTHGVATTEKECRAFVKEASLAHHVIEKYYPEAVISKPGAKDLAVPV
jgi:hypothetical protein